MQPNYIRVKNHVFPWFVVFLVLIATATPCAAIEISGLLETEIGSETSYEGDKNSDIVQATVEIALDAKLNQRTDLHVLLLYEDDGETPLDVDEAVVTIRDFFLTNLTLKLGQQYMPFGWFQTNMISDPFTLELAETRESAVVLSYGGNLNFSLFIFNGDVEKANTALPNNSEPDPENKIDNFGASLRYAHETSNLTFDLGVDYINNLGESDALSAIIALDPTTDPDIDIGAGPVGVQDYTPGIASHLFIKLSTLSFSAEHIFAVDEFKSPLIRSGPARPSALNGELGIDLSENNSFAVGAQKSVDADGLGLPEFRVLLAYSHRIDDTMGVAVEYRRDTDYPKPGESGKTAQGITMQFSANF